MALVPRLSAVVVVLVVTAACAGSSDDPLTAADTVGSEPATASESASTTTAPPATTESPPPTVPPTVTAEHAGLQVSVTPATGLRDGQTIQVSVATDTGFPVGAAICLEEQIEHDLAACDLGTARELDRNATTTFVVARFLTTQNAMFDCAVESCVLGVAAFDRSAQVTLPLTFVGDEPVPDPDIEPLQPERVSTDVPDSLGFRELVNITIEGPLGPHSPSVAQCVVDDFVHPLADMTAPGVDPTICWNHVGRRGDTTADDPLADIDRVVIATLLTSNWDASDIGPDEPVDCRVVACELVVSDGTRLLDRIPLDFDPDIDWPGWPSATATPATYRPGDRLVLEATGLRPGVAHPVSQCVHFDRYGVSCEPIGEGPLVVDDRGAGVLEVAPTERVDGHTCAECWFWIFDPDVPENVWQMRVDADIDLVLDP